MTKEREIKRSKAQNALEIISQKGTEQKLSSKNKIDRGGSDKTNDMED